MIDFFSIQNWKRKTMVELELIFMVCRLLPVWKNSRLNANIKKIDVKEMVPHYFSLISAYMTVLQRHRIS